MVRAGFCGPKHQDRFCIRLESYNTVLQRELLPSKICGEEIIGVGRMGKTIWIYADSQGALRAIGEIHTCYKLVMETKVSLIELGNENLLNLT